MSMAVSQEIIARATHEFGRSFHGAQMLKGGNNILWELKQNGTSFCLKIYPNQQMDQRNRMEAEIRFYRFLATTRFPKVPELIGISTDWNATLTRWVGGEKIETPGQSDLDSLLSFVRFLAETNHPSAELPNASHATFNRFDLLAQISNRREMFTLARQVHLNLDQIFCQIIDPEAERFSQHLIKTEKAWPKIPSPSDLGFHNALRQDDGTLVFFDFEYGGWDSPVKLINDLWFHPKNQLDLALSTYRDQQLQFLFGEEIWAEAQAVRRGFALIWMMIVLGEFLPQRWERRKAAGETTAVEVVQAEQLTKAYQIWQPSHNRS